MPIHATRRLRSLAATLMLLSGISHVAQLWFNPLDTPVLISALFGMMFLLLSLGLSGQSRFTLWITIFAVILNGISGGTELDMQHVEPVLAWHLAVDLVVALLCVYIVFRTRYSEMD